MWLDQFVVPYSQVLKTTKQITTNVERKVAFNVRFIRSLVTNKKMFFDHTNESLNYLSFFESINLQKFDLQYSYGPALSTNLCGS